MPDFPLRQLTILLIVRDEGPIHGHAIRGLVESFSNGELTGGLSSTYEALYSLERQGYLSSSEVVSEAGRNRREYSITGLGSETLEREAALASRVIALIRSRPEVQPGPA